MQWHHQFGLESEAHREPSQTSTMKHVCENSPKRVLNTLLTVTEQSHCDNDSNSIPVINVYHFINISVIGYIIFADKRSNQMLFVKFWEFTFKLLKFDFETKTFSKRFDQQHVCQTLSSKQFSWMNIT